MEKLKLPAMMYSAEAMGTDSKNWYEVKFEDCKPFYCHGLKRDRDEGYWVELHNDSKVTSYLIEKKCIEWTVMPIQITDPTLPDENVIE